VEDAALEIECFRFRSGRIVVEGSTRMLRRWHRFYTTYPNIGLIRSTNGLDKKEPRTHRLVCRFEDQETDATFVSDRLRKTVRSFIVPFSPCS